MRTLVLAATWGTLILEIGVALTSLVPGGPFARRLRHGSLLGFCFSTYAFAPVAGFGWLLHTEIPWAALLGSWVGIR